MEGPEIQKDAVAEDLKYFCKICKRKFACGRALGGHMRAHGAAEEELQRRIKSKEPNGTPVLFLEEEEEEEEEGLNSMYSLRRNPKRSWRFADRDYSFLVAEDGASGSRKWGSAFVRNSEVCEDCGKEFSSWKALLGHMRCHSDRAPSAHPDGEAERNPKRVWEDSAENRRRDWDVFRQNSRVNIERTAGISSESSESGSESGSEADSEHRPDGNPGEFYSPAKGRRSKRPRCSQNRDPPVNSDEEDMANCLVMLASGGRKLDEFQRAADSSATSVCVDAKLAPAPAEEEGASELQKGCGSSSSGGRSKTREFGPVSKKKPTYECKTCRKIFHTYQALGGHRASHKKVKGCFARITVLHEEGIVYDEQLCRAGDKQNFPEQAAEFSHSEAMEEIADATCASTRAPKVHECSICHRTFASGQALGGHKRCHFLISDAAASTATKQPRQIKAAATEELLDLNLPAPPEDDNSLRGGDATRPNNLANNAARPVRPADVEPCNRVDPCHIRPWWMESDSKQGLFL